MNPLNKKGNNKFFLDSAKQSEKHSSTILMVRATTLEVFDQQKQPLRLHVNEVVMSETISFFFNIFENIMRVLVGGLH
jgi:hypothetical protein